jgi:hypothetical protein
MIASEDGVVCCDDFASGMPGATISAADPVLAFELENRLVSQSKIPMYRS